jgi:chaperonin GroES
MKLKAVFDAIIVKEIEQDESQFGSIIVPDMGKEKHIIGEVIDVGPGRRSIMTGEIFKPYLKVGQKVILPRVGITSLFLEGEEYIGCDEGKVLAILED